MIIYLLTCLNLGGDEVAEEWTLGEEVKELIDWSPFEGEKVDRDKPAIQESENTTD